MSRKFNYQIEQELKKHDWEIVQIYSTEKWWDSEHWKICPKYTTSVCFYLCFIVDPLFEGNSENGQRISEIKLTSKVPENWNDDTHTIASMHMSKGNFDQKLGDFMDHLKQQWHTT